MLGRRARPAPPPPARLAALAGLWAGAGLLGLGSFLAFSTAVPKIGLPAHLAIATLPLAACLGAQAVIFLKLRLLKLRLPSPAPRSLAITPAPARAAPLPDAPAPPVARLLLDAASRPETEAERREIAARRAHDPDFAAAATGLDETATRALLASWQHAVQAPLPPDPRRDQIHAALAATAPAAAAGLLEALREAPDLDPARVAATLMRGLAAASPYAAPQAPLDEARLAAALEALSRLGPVTAQPNPDGGVTLRPATRPRVKGLPALGDSGVLLAPPG